MNVQRIMLTVQRCIILRFLRIEALIDFVYWPLLDIMFAGGIGLALSKNSLNDQMLTLTLTSVLMMRIFLYIYFDIALNFLYEITARNMINLFASPLTFTEWLIATMVSGIFTSTILFVFVACMAWLIFGVSLVSMGPIFLIFLLPLLLCGWALGYFATMILMLLGAQGQRIERIIGWLFIPFMGIYYSITIMPHWVQAIAAWIPMSYIFQLVRVYILENKISYLNLAYGYGLSIIYYIIALIACHLMFERSRQLGLASLERA